MIILMLTFMLQSGVSDVSKFWYMHYLYKNPDPIRQNTHSFGRSSRFPQTGGPCGACSPRAPITPSLPPTPPTGFGPTLALPSPDGLGYIS
ncbi:hypothetical protein PGTUg99_003346 [Puccinia graminis f. sp. tritici]|uniref:Uncharacterized protein n=1 Tax=Puccinia graminis f. sp. tritici TaxID=56615 RepID=A0A5B0N513_PUCGR|nr:hypothetical protein PGTUg99_003346 [Puccinia graminis f. sp. tritici]